VRRPLDPTRPSGPQLDIHFVVVPAIARRRLPDPVFLLAGGPGQSAIALAPAVLPLFARLNNRRDIVFVDQRGTGRSAPLECEDERHAPLSKPADTGAQLAQLQSCLARLATTAPLTSADDLRFFTTPIAMQDLDAVRARLGAERINLVGASYGTRAALDYARQFPDRVRRSVLDGAAPPDMVLPASGGTDTQAAFDAMLVDCERSPGCHRTHPNLRAAWIGLLASLPKQVNAAHPLTGRRETFTLDRDRLLGAVRGPLYAPSLAAGLPQAISEAAQGRYESLLGLSSALTSRRQVQPAMGMHFSVVCAEDGPLLPTEAPPVASEASPASTAAAFVDHAARLYQRACAFWPRGTLPEAFYRIPTGSTATLLLSGGLDPATPPRHGERVARTLGPKALHVVVPNAGHGLMGVGCVRDLMFRFIAAEDDAAAGQLDASCVSGVPRPPAFEPVDPSATASEKGTR
jgi:pimeloyl-ACP methyl ester carboxylesterase